MKVLISGGNGYIGRLLTRYLMQDHQVCVVDNLRYGHLRFDAHELKHFHFHTVDIRELDQISEIIQDFQPDVIIHLAAIHFIPDCENTPSLAVTTNIQGTVNLLTLCPKGCRFVFASSGAVYHPQENPHDEIESPVGPMDIYGFTKLQGEDYVRYFCQLRQFPAVIVRLFNVVGPGETNPHVLPEIFAQLKAGHRTLQLGNLTPKRNYVDVRDAASGFWAVTSCGDISTGTTVTVNLASRAQYSVSEILDRIRDLGCMDIEVKQDSTRVRKIDRPFLAADISRIQSLFNWKPQHDIEDPIREMLKDPDLPPSLIAKYNL